MSLGNRLAMPLSHSSQLLQHGCDSGLLCLCLKFFIIALHCNFALFHGSEWIHLLTSYFLYWFQYSIKNGPFRSNDRITKNWREVSLGLQFSFRLWQRLPPPLASTSSSSPIGSMMVARCTHPIWGSGSRWLRYHVWNFYLLAFPRKLQWG